MGIFRNGAALGFVRKSVRATENPDRSDCSKFWLDLRTRNRETRPTTPAPLDMKLQEPPFAFAMAGRRRAQSSKVVFCSRSATRDLERLPSTPEDLGDPTAAQTGGSRQVSAKQRSEIIEICGGDVTSKI